MIHHQRRPKHHRRAIFLDALGAALKRPWWWICFLGSSRNSGRSLDVQGLKSGCDQKAPLTRILSRKAPRGGTEEYRGSRRKEENSGAYKPSDPFRLFARHTHRRANAARPPPANPRRTVFIESQSGSEFSGVVPLRERNHPSESIPPPRPRYPGCRPGWIRRRSCGCRGSSGGGSRSLRW